MTSPVPRAKPVSASGAPWGVGRTAAPIALLAALAVFHVWGRTRVVAAGYALGELQRAHVSLESEHDRLRIEVETLRSPAALERVARTRLGMAPPAPGAVSAAGPRVAEAGEGGRGMDEVQHRPGPAEPSPRTSFAARSAAGEGASRSTTVALRGGAAEGTPRSTTVALRLPPRAGRAPAGR
jgi:cell division protein FtsL